MSECGAIQWRRLSFYVWPPLRKKHQRFWTSKTHEVVDNFCFCLPVWPCRTLLLLCRRLGDHFRNRQRRRIPDVVPSFLTRPVLKQSHLDQHRRTQTGLWPFFFLFLYLSPLKKACMQAASQHRKYVPFLPRKAPAESHVRRTLLPFFSRWSPFERRCQRGAFVMSLIPSLPTLYSLFFLQPTPGRGRRERQTRESLLVFWRTRRRRRKALVGERERRKGGGKRWRSKKVALPPLLLLLLLVFPSNNDSLRAWAWSGLWRGQCA